MGRRNRHAGQSRDLGERVLVAVAKGHQDGHDLAGDGAARLYRVPGHQPSLLLVPFAGGWRADLQLRPDDEPESFNAPGAVAEWIARVLPEKYVDRISWISTYQFLQVIASSFTDTQHRVLLVGEAAHLFAPFGARGLNSGVPDAGCAAAAIRTAVWAASHSEATSAIDAFAQRRRAAAIYNRDTAGLALAHMQAGSARTRWKRQTAAWAAVLGQRAGSWLDSSPYGPRAAAHGTGAIY
jgi:3-(3-hydroxy-phenyl)propionate hydroxylase